MADAVVQQAPIATDVPTAAPVAAPETQPTPAPSQDISAAPTPPSSDSGFSGLLMKGLNFLSNPIGIPGIGLGSVPDMDSQIQSSLKSYSSNTDSEWGKAANDVADILAAPANIVAHPITAAENFIPATVTGLKQGVESLTIPFGGNPENIKAQWAAHPVLQTLNLVGLGDIFGGLISAGARGAIRSGVIDEAGAAADTAAAEGTLTAEQAATVKSTITPKLINGVITHLMNGKSQALVTDMLNNAYTKAGLDAPSAAKLTQGTLESIAQKMQDSIALRAGNVLSHPFSTAGGIVSPYISDVAKSVFSKPSASAVSYLFGDDAIKQNPTAFAQMEESASQQLRERGLEDTVQNRIGIMSDWAKTNPDWAALNAQGKAAHMTQFSQTTPFIRTINEETGRTYVPVKALSVDNATAAVSDVTDLPGAMDAPIDVGHALDQLEETLGRNIGNWRATIEQAVVNNPTKQGLIDAILSITRKGSFNFPSSETAAQAARDMEEATGYRVGLPPKGKPINFVSETPDLSFLGKPTTNGTVPSVFNNEQLNKLLTNANWFQGMLDRFGLSTHGATATGLDAMYGDQFGKNFTTDFGSKYADGLKLPRIVVSGSDASRIGLESGSRTIPQSGVYSYLARNLNKISATANTVADLSARDLTNWGFSKDASADIISTAKKSMQLPIAATGVGQGLVNFMRARIPGFNKYLNTTIGLKYNSPLAVFYQARVFTKYNLLRQFATGKFVLNLGDNSFSNWLAERPFVGNIIAPKVTTEDAALMGNTVWRDIHGSTFDMSTSPEVMSYLDSEAPEGTRASGILTDIKNQAQRGLLSWVNFSVRNDSVTLAKGLAAKYGMTLRDALSYTTNKAGERVYKNPAVYNSILDSIEATYHYAPGVLTSPMMRNLNTLFYPLRFETKVLMQTAKWFNNLSPVTRGEMMLNMTHFAAWTATDSGKAWLQKNQNVFSTALNYLVPFAEEGKTLSSAMQGKIFTGDIGELGGIPFAFPVQLMQQLSLLPGQPTNQNPSTGKDYTKRTPKKLVSSATAEAAFQNFFTTMLPSFPLYSILGSGAPAVSTVEQEALQKAFIALTTGQTSAQSNRKMNQQFKNVKEGYFRF